MRSYPQAAVGIPPEQQAIRARCYHPTGTFTVFETEQIEQSIPGRFEQQVGKYPNRLAVKTRSDLLTYDALNRATNRVAHVMLSRRSGDNEPVALLLEHDATTVIAILGVLKAGKFYVPLDPSFPPARLTILLEDIGSGLIVTNTQNFPRAQAVAPPGCDVLNIDAIDLQTPTEDPALSLSPHLFAALLYTSGSTGQPKGVLQSHRTVLERARNATNTFHICPDDRLALLYSYVFSASLRVIFSALLNGATLCLFNIKQEGLVHLGSWLSQEGITFYSSVASLFRYFASNLKTDEVLPCCRLIYVGSEPVLRRDVELYKKHFTSHCLMVNSLSSGEAGAVRQYFIDKNTPITDNVVPVGYAVEDKEVLLLDESGAEVDTNHVGEIAVKSRYLSPGYWRQPGLTNMVFTPDPAGGSARIYRTGDLGLMRPDGCLLYFGRKDFQLKIHGRRIEVAEIEMVLLDHPAVKEAAVVAREYRSEERQLVAYLVSGSRPAPSVSSLRCFVKERLPDYMVPAAFVVLDALPLTATGKVNYGALPAPDWERSSSEHGFVAPRTPVESELAKIWAEVLGLARVGIQDSFVELGGHSLLATQIASRVRDTFHVDVTLRSLLEAPAVAHMAEIITQSQANRVQQDAVEGLLAQVEALTEEQAQRLVADEMKLS